MCKLLFSFVLLTFISCGSDDGSYGTNPVSKDEVEDVVDEPKYVCYNHWKRKKYYRRKCKFVYIRDIKGFSCKCKYRR